MMTTDEFKEKRRGIFTRLTEIIVLRKLAHEQELYAILIYDPQTAHKMRQSAYRKRSRAARLEHELKQQENP